jgi:hypothetical protein
MNLTQQYDQARPVSFDQAREIWNNESINTPGYDKIGLYNYDDMNTGGFLWFESREDLIFFLLHVWPVILAGEDLSLQEWNRWMIHAPQIIFGSADPEKHIEYINDYWQGDITIGWIGSLTELETSTTDINGQLSGKIL